VLTNLAPTAHQILTKLEVEQDVDNLIDIDNQLRHTLLITLILRFLLLNVLSHNRFFSSHGRSIVSEVNPSLAHVYETLS
jgi:hypothetical protein